MTPFIHPRAAAGQVDPIHCWSAYRRLINASFRCYAAHGVVTAFVATDERRMGRAQVYREVVLRTQADLESFFAANHIAF